MYLNIENERTSTFQVVVHYVDIGGIVDHHCLKFLFKSTLFSLASLNPPKSFGLFLILSNLIPNIKSDDSIKYYNLKKGWPHGQD